jgi:hypothetical protein
MLLDGRLADSLSSIVVNTATSIYAREDEITHPKVREVARELHRVVVQEHAAHQLGFYRTAGEQFARVLAQDITPPPPRLNWWQRLLAGSSE